MTRLSVNINKIATLRNARGGNVPDVLLAAERVQAFGAHGVTVHPRPDERHITYADARALRKVVTTEYNIEGNPIEAFNKLVLAIVPEQVTFVPDAPDAITSNAGWDTVRHAAFLQPLVAKYRERGVRVSLFVDADEAMVEGAARVGAQRVELYTEPYAAAFAQGEYEAVLARYVKAAERARALGLEVNAGHDLDQKNLQTLLEAIPFLAEVSIGHALIAEALYQGLETTIGCYLTIMQRAQK